MESEHTLVEFASTDLLSSLITSDVRLDLNNLVRVILLKFLQLLLRINWSLLVSSSLKLTSSSLML